MIANPERFDKTIALFDAANAQDPNPDEGQPKELLYAQRMTAMIDRFAADASEVAATTRSASPAILHGAPGSTSFMPKRPAS